MPPDDSKAPGPEPLTIDLSSITSAPVEVPGADSGPRSQKEATMLAHEAEQFKKELGLLGVPFGGRSEKPGNISALVICACLFFMPVVYGTERYLAVKYGKDAGTFDFERVFTSLTSIITLILGYLFGSNEKSGK